MSEQIETGKVEETPEELLTPKQKEGLFKLLDKVRDGVLNNEQFLLAMKLFVDECDNEETPS